MGNSLIFEKYQEYVTYMKNHNLPLISEYQIHKFKDFGIEKVPFAYRRTKDGKGIYPLYRLIKQLDFLYIQDEYEEGILLFWPDELKWINKVLDTNISINANTCLYGYQTIDPIVKISASEMQEYVSTQVFITNDSKYYIYTLEIEKVMKDLNLNLQEIKKCLLGVFFNKNLEMLLVFDFKELEKISSKRFVLRRPTNKIAEKELVDLCNLYSIESAEKIQNIKDFMYSSSYLKNRKSAAYDVEHFYELEMFGTALMEYVESFSGDLSNDYILVHQDELYKFKAIFLVDNKSTNLKGKYQDSFVFSKPDTKKLNNKYKRSLLNVTNGEEIVKENLQYLTTSYLSYDFLIYFNRRQLHDLGRVIGEFVSDFSYDDNDRRNHIKKIEDLKNSLDEISNKELAFLFFNSDRVNKSRKRKMYLTEEFIKNDSYYNQLGNIIRSRIPFGFAKNYLNNVDKSPNQMPIVDVLKVWHEFV